MKILAKAPTRVDLAGGTLDIWPLYLFHPGAVTVNAAITRYAYCTIETNSSGDARIRLISRDTNREETFASFAALARVQSIVHRLVVAMQAKLPHRRYRLLVLHAALAAPADDCRLAVPFP